MGYIKTMGIVLRHKKVFERDAIIEVLTADMGVISASVKGAENYKNRNAQGASLFSYSEFVLAGKPDIYNVRSCVLNKSFYNLATNIERLAYATYIADLVRFVCTDDLGDERILPLVLNTFYLLANSNKDLRIIKCVFELKLLCLSGMNPELHACTKCGSAENLCGFSANEGGILCKKCTNFNTVSTAAISALRYITESPDSKSFSFTATNSVVCEISEIAQSLILKYTDKEFYSLNYLNKLIGK